MLSELLYATAIVRQVSVIGACYYILLSVCASSELLVLCDR